jgi:hypothetical protein
MDSSPVTRIGRCANPQKYWFRSIPERNGSVDEFFASVVVVPPGVINSAALLLRFASDKHPRGLANSSDVAGWHYMGHVNPERRPLRRTGRSI